MVTTVHVPNEPTVTFVMFKLIRCPSVPLKVTLAF